MLGPTLTSAPLVRKDSPIRTVHDMRGKRVTGEYPAQPHRLVQPSSAR